MNFMNFFGSLFNNIMDIKIIFPDNKEMSFEAGITAGEAVGIWKKEALAYTVAVKINRVAVDLSTILKEDSTLNLMDISSTDGLAVLRHSISHVMAQAVQDIFKGAKVSIGPSIEDGFYYDFEHEEPFTADDFPKIENRMKEIIAANYSFVREDISRGDAVKLFDKRGETYKVELIMIWMML